MARYVCNADGYGWLKVKWPDDSTYPPLPQYTKVEHLGTAGGRDSFKVLEGRMKDKEGSVKEKAPGESYLLTGNPWLEAAKVKFKRKSKQLFFGGSEAVETFTQDTNPVPAGTFDLEIPDEVHSLGSGYLTASKFATTWFRIGHSGDRYLHPGSVSAGCATVSETSAWTKIYEYLIARRKGDGKSVGTIVVTDD